MPSVLEAEFQLKWRVGARTAFLIAHTARRFRSKIQLTHESLRIDAKNIIGVCLLGPVRDKLPDGSYNFGPDAGASIRLTIEGPDADAAMNELADLFTCGERVIQCRNSDCISSAILTGYDRYRIFYSCSNFHMWAVRRASSVTLVPRFRFRRAASPPVFRRLRPN